jgi:hypothetical protein
VLGREVPVASRPSDNHNGKTVLEDGEHRIVVAPTWLDEPRPWLMTAFKKEVGRPLPSGPLTPGKSELLPRFSVPDGISTGAGVSDNIIARGEGRNIVPDALPPGFEIEPGAGTRPEPEAPDPRDALAAYRLTPKGTLRRNPLDLAAWLRTRGGIQDQRGALSALGIDNRPRQIPLSGDVGLPRLVNANGLKLDDAAEAAWHAGYFPNRSDRPTVAEFLDALGETHRGGPGRVFHPEDHKTVDAYNRALDELDAIAAARRKGRH